MFRPFVFAAVFLITGILLGAHVIWPTVFVVTSLGSLALCLKTKDLHIKRLFMALAIIFAGAFYYNFFVNNSMGDILTLAGDQRTLIGLVSDLPRVEENKATYDVRVLYYLDEDNLHPISGKIRLTTPVNDDSRIYKYKDVIQFTGNLKVPQKKRNPGGIDYRAFLAQKGITLSCFSREIIKLGDQKANPFVNGAYSLRSNIMSFFQDHLPPETAALMSGITLGVKDQIPKETLRFFSDAGLSHLLAVSGLHMGIIYGVLKSCLYKIGTSDRLFFVMSTGFILFYCFMAGLSPSAVRASIMIITFLLGQSLGERTDSLNNLGLAATVLVIMNPLNIFSISFQLSFGATLGILLFFERIKGALTKVPEQIATSLAVVISAQLLVAPFIAYHFNKLSLAGFLTNLILVPLAGVTLILGLGSGILGLIFPKAGALAIKLPGGLLAFMELIVSKTYRLPLTRVLIPSLPLGMYIIYFALLGLFFWDTPAIPRSHRAMVAIGLIIILAVPMIQMNMGLEVTFIDVGQGDAIFIQTPQDQRVLIDGGGVPRYYDGDFDPGGDIVLPFLYSRGVNKIDIVVVSHFDDDHARGLISVLENIDVGALVYGYPSKAKVFYEIQEVANRRHVPMLQVGRGDNFSLGEVKFQVLGPPRERPGGTENDRSVVLKMLYNSISFLFTGDLELEGERDLIRTGEDLKTTVLKLGHHGSDTSTSQDFLHRVSPVFAVIPVGLDNSYGHPSPEVLERLEQEGIKVFRTDLHGGISFKIYGKDVKIYTSIPEEHH